MPTNILKTRIQSKYDTLAHWNASTFKPLPGELCIAVIPNGKTGNDQYKVGDPVNNQLSPYAIGVKVGDGDHTFAQLPWIQAIAGDVYGWAKAPSGADSIYVDYNTTKDKTIQQAITAIKESISGIVSSGISADALEDALSQLTEQLSGTQREIFASNPLSNDDPPEATYPTHIIRTLVQNGLNVTATSSPITEADLPNISLNKITGLNISNSYGDNNPIATIGDISTSINDQLSKILTFAGVSTTVITDGGTETPTINGVQKTPKLGDVVLYQASKTLGTENITSTLEFVWTGTAWELLGDENSYAIKGSIKKSDLDNSLQTEITGKLNSTDAASTYVAQVAGSRLITNDEANKLSNIENGAQVNVIENIKINGGNNLTITNKTVDIDVPLIGLQQHSSYGNTNSTTDVTITNRKIALDEIAFNGEVRNLKQTDNTILVFYCGDADEYLFE